MNMENRQRFLRDMKELVNEHVTFHVFAGISKKARGYYRAEILPKIAERIGQDPDSVHILLKFKFNPIEMAVINPDTGEEETYVIGGSFEDLGGAAFAKKLDEIKEWGRSFLGADIREPTLAETAAILAKE